MNEMIFLQSAIQQFRDYKSLGDKTFVQLQDDDLHYQPNEATNSIAIIITHLHGNMLSRWTNFLTEDGEKEWRQRDDELKHILIRGKNCCSYGKKDGRRYLMRWNHYRQPILKKKSTYAPNLLL